MEERKEYEGGMQRRAAGTERSARGKGEMRLEGQAGADFAESERHGWAFGLYSENRGQLLWSGPLFGKTPLAPAQRWKHEGACM